MEITKIGKSGKYTDGEGKKVKYGAEKHFALSKWIDEEEGRRKKKRRQKKKEGKK